MSRFAGVRRLLLALAPPPRQESIATAEAGNLLSDRRPRLVLTFLDALLEGRRV